MREGMGQPGQRSLTALWVWALGPSPVPGCSI
jgi:hypothetical protein